MLANDNSFLSCDITHDAFPITEEPFFPSFSYAKVRRYWVQVQVCPKGIAA